MTIGQLERFAGFILRKYLPQSAASAHADIVSGEFEKKAKAMSDEIADAALDVPIAERDKIVHNTIERLKEAYEYYSN